MRPIVVVISLPFLEFLTQSHIVLVAEKLIELFLIGPMGSFHFAVEFR
jgi:hypothetical protein